MIGEAFLGQILEGSGKTFITPIFKRIYSGKLKMVTNFIIILPNKLKRIEFLTFGTIVTNPSVYGTIGEILITVANKELQP